MSGFFTARGIVILAIAAHTGLLGSFSHSARASIVAVDASRSLVHTQTGNGNSLVSGGAVFSTSLQSSDPNDYSTVTMTHGGPSSPLALTKVTPSRFSYQSALFPGKAAMDAAFPTGTYQYNTNVGDSVSYLFSADLYSQSLPFLTGSDFSGLSGINPANPFTVHFNPFVTGPNATESFISFSIDDTTTNGNVLDQFLLPASTTSVTIPANTLSPNHQYTYSLIYSNRRVITGAGTPAPRFVLAFDQKTTGSFSIIPEPSTLAFGFGVVAVAFFRSRRSDR